ncbi:MAG TPA: rod shape-determining protein MreD [Tepidisphaeraceae bacterium]|nr:rod shape-determining protein MreD [Tepidisphaeraceae bacterium]
MRLLPYILLAYVALALQVGAGRYLQWHGAQPMLPLMAVVFIALNAPKDAALLAAFGVGLLQDLLSAQPIGLFGFAYGTAAALVTATQSVVYRGHPLTHALMTLLGGLVTMGVLLLHTLIHPIPLSRAALDAAAVGTSVRTPPMTLLIGVGYSAVLAPIVVGVLNKLRRLFAFQQPKRSAGAMYR